MEEIGAQVPHFLSKAEAAARLREFADHLPNQYPSQFHFPESQWEGDELKLSFTLFGFRVRWDISVHSTFVDLSCSLPVAARMFDHKMEQLMVRKISSILESDESTQVVRRAA